MSAPAEQHDEPSAPATKGGTKTEPGLGLAPEAQPAGVRVLAETGWLPSAVMLPSAAIVTA